VIYAESPARFLLLDEPSNPLDFAALNAVESLLNQYQGTLMVISHDEVFLDQIGLTRKLRTGENGWVFCAINTR